MITKRELLVLYDQAIALIKQVKIYNDKLNKKLGVADISSLLCQSEAETQIIDKTYEKVENLIKKMEQGYIDPETARKIGNVKQQLRNQKDRRNQLMESLHEVAKNNPEANKKTAEKQKVKQTFQMQQSNFKTQDLYQYHSLVDEPENKNDHSRYSEVLTQDQTSHKDSQVMIEINDFDYEMQRKLMNQKNKQIGSAHSRMTKIKDIMDQSEEMVNYQGDMLDLIGEDLFVSHKNAVATNMQIGEAQQMHRRFKKRTCLFILFLLTLLAAAVYFYLYIL